jgi:hypothetical protein
VAGVVYGRIKVGNQELLAPQNYKDRRAATIAIALAGVICSGTGVAFDFTEQRALL